MSGWLVTVAALGGRAAGSVVEAFWWLAERWTVRRGRPAVRVAVERATAPRVRVLVPDQRRSADPVWWEFVPQDGDR